MLTIEQLYLYPVKSLRGFTLEAAVLTPQGLQHDRQWMIIDSNNKFVTQRKYAQMVLIHTAFREHDGKKQLVLSHSQKTDITPLTIDVNSAPTGTPFDATIWKDTCAVLDEGQAASDWLSAALGIPQLRLVRMAHTPRPQSKPELLGDNTHTYFADAAPYLIANEKSLAEINLQMANNSHAPVPMENFRPNIVLQGLTAFEEHEIAGFEHEFGAYTLSHRYPCQRCVMPTVNIETGERHPKQQPFSLIRDINPMPDNPKAPAFGENAILLQGDGEVIRVGDCVKPLD
ncbi:MOSC domain-containing protein [Eionea flava]